MFQHVTDHQIDGYIRQRLPPAELLSLADHLAECEACRRLIERALGGDLSFLALRSAILSEAKDASAGHPDPTSMAAYVDGTLSGEELQALKDHLTQCDHCSLTAEDLRSFATAGSQWRAAAEGGAALSPWRWALAAGVVLVVGAGWFIWQGRETRTTPPQIVRANPEPLIDDQLPAPYQRMMKEALTNQRLETSPLLASLNRPGSALKGAGDPRETFSLYEPVGTVSESDRPTFRWSDLGSGATYSVEIYDEAFESIARSPRLSVREWTPQKPLTRGQTYSWQVRAVKDGRELLSPQPPAPQAKFRILDAASVKELEEARRAYPSSHLLLAVLSARAGLLEESEKELRLLHKQNPDSAVVRRLLDQLPSPTSTNPAQ